MFDYFKKSQKLLGMNSRNLNFIREYNSRKSKRIADNKILTKKVLAKNGLAVSTLIAKIKSKNDLDVFDWSKLPGSFALKPNRGFGGEGILVVYGKKKGRDDVWVKADGSVVSVDDLKSHIQNILDGSFSLSNTPDMAFFEERLQLLKLFKPYTFKGIPDIRVVVFNKVPVMAMLRLPTKDSGGKANLQQGAIGVGIDMALGVTTTAVWKKSKIIDYLPGSRLVLSGIRIPYWQDILRLAVRTQEISGLGFLGVDVSIDKEKGPVVLELNARPGLAIQVANLCGLRERLERVKGIQIKTLERGVRLGMDLFGGEIEEEVEDISGRKVIGSIEKIKLLAKDGKEIELEAKVDTGANSTSLDVEVARQLGLGELLDKFSQLDLSSYSILPENEKQIKKEILEKYQAAIPDLANVAVVFSSSGATIRPVAKVDFIMDQLTITSKINIIDRKNMQYKMIIGRSDLGMK